MRNWIANMSRWCNRYEWIIFLLLLTIALRLPSLFAPHHYGDEEIYFVMGRAWETGEGMYRAAFDHKPPMIYVIAGIAKSVFWFRTILLLWMMAHTYIFWKLAQRIWSKISPKMAYLSSLLFVLLASWPMLEGDIANAELFMMMPVSLSLLILLTMREGLLKYMMAGLVAGIGLLFKVPVIFDIAAFVVFFFAFEKKSFFDGVKSLLGLKMWTFLLAFLLPIILTVINYQVKGVGADYIRAAVMVNFGYVSSWETSTFSFNPFASGLVVRGMVLAAYTLVLYLLRSRLSKQYLLVLLWLGYSVFGALLSGRPYPHYLLQPIAPAALLLPFVFVMDKILGWVIFAAVIILGIVTQKQIGFWGYPTLATYQNFAAYMSGGISRDQFVATFDGAARNHKVAKYLEEKLQESDQIYVWANDVAVYNLLDKLPSGGKYMVDFHVRDWKAYDEVMTNLNTKKPKYVLVYPNSVAFPALMTWLDQGYIKINEIEGVAIWRTQSD